MKAMARGTAVRASPKLWMRSASNATLPLATNTTACAAAVVANTPSDWVTARTPPLDLFCAVVDQTVRVPQLDASTVRTMATTTRMVGLSASLSDGS
jgi:hypothetical protein